MVFRTTEGERSGKKKPGPGRQVIRAEDERVRSACNGTAASRRGM